MLSAMHPIASARVWSILPPEIKGSGLAGAMHLKGFSRASYHPSGPFITCNLPEINPQESSDKELIENSENQETTECQKEHIAVAWPSLEFSPTIPDLIRQKNNEDRAEYLTHHLGSYLSLQSQAGMAYIREQSAIGLEIQENTNILITHDIDQYGIEALIAERQRQFNLFHSSVYPLNPSFTFGIKAGFSQLGYFRNSAALLDVDALRQIQTNHGLKFGFMPLLDLAFSYHSYFGLILRNAIRQNYRTSLFSGNLLKNNSTSLDLAIAAPLFQHRLISVDAFLEIFDLINEEKDDFIKKFHSGFVASSGMFAFRGGISQGNLSNALIAKSEHYWCGIGTISYELGNTIAFRTDPRYFLSCKSIF